MCTKSEWTLLKILKSIDTLKEINLWIKEKVKNKDQVNSYIFKNLTKSRREQVVDAIWGLDPPYSGDISIWNDLKWLQDVSDSITCLN